MEIEKVKEELKKRLSTYRYEHSLGTMKKAKELAKLYGEDEKQAEFAGLIHDVAKELTKEQIEEYINKYNIELDEVEKQNFKLLHAKLGAVIAREEFGANQEVQDAIKYHTTGNKKMDTFAKIIYIADKIEENRTYDEVEKIRKMAEENLDNAILYMLEYVIKKNNQKGVKVHPDTLELREMLSRK